MTEKTRDSGDESQDQNTFDRLRLSAIPLENAQLRTMQLIKTAQMETMLELLNDPLSGSLQIHPRDISSSFAINPQDQGMIDKLAALNSYDVYSLRASLQELDITISPAALELSSGMKEKLQKYALEFTRPLILSIFGSGDVEEESNLQRIVRDPNRERVTQRLALMSAKTGIPVPEIPDFLKNYGDLFLSGAYYRYTFDNIQPEITRFAAWMAELKGERAATSWPVMLERCVKAEDMMKFLCAAVEERLDNFKAEFELFWGDMNRRSFRNLEKKIEMNYSVMGSLLCGLTVQMRVWSKTFPATAHGSDNARMIFVTSVLTPGLRKLADIENDARLMAASL